MSDIRDVHDHVRRFAQFVNESFGELSDLLAELEPPSLSEVRSELERVQARLEDVDLYSLQNVVNDIENQLQDVEHAVDSALAELDNIENDDPF